MSSSKSEKAEFKQLLAKRTRIHSTLQRIAEFVDNFDENTGNISEITARLETFNELWSKYDPIQDAIMVADPTDNDASLFEESYFQTKAKINNFLLDHQANTSTVVEVTKSQTSQDQSYFQLEKMKLPEFDGN